LLYKGFLDIFNFYYLTLLYEYAKIYLLNIQTNKKMKYIIFTVAIISSFFISTSFGGVSTFDGHKVSWGWSNKDSYSKDSVVKILQENLDKVSPLSLQQKVDQVTSAEFLWKVTPDVVADAMASGSTFMTGEHVSLVVLAFQASGSGEILLYSGDRLVGRTRCWTSGKREGREFTQLAEGSYPVTGLESKGYSKEFQCAMPNKVSLGGKAAGRGIFIHTGDISGPQGDNNKYHGCIRVSEPVGKQLMHVLSTKSTVQVEWR
jgi:hypothetical protein